MVKPLKFATFSAIALFVMVISCAAADQAKICVAKAIEALPNQ
jgi:hypothetical protein